jgi:hypothetical protein
MFRKSPLHVPPVSGACVWGSEEVWYDLSVQDGRLHEEHAERQRSVYGDVATNSRFDLLPCLLDLANKYRV